LCTGIIGGNPTAMCSRDGTLPRDFLIAGVGGICTSELIIRGIGISGGNVVVARATILIPTVKSFSKMLLLSA